MDSTELFEQNKSLVELKEFSEAQQKVIIQLNRKIQKLESERNHLQELLEKAPVQLFPSTIQINQDVLPEKAICLMQIDRLKEVSMGRELTLEEARKLEIYNKVLNGNQQKESSIDVKTRNIKDEDLLKMLDSEKK